MAQENSQNPKKKYSLNPFKRSATPDPSGPSQKRSLMGRMKSTFSKSASSLSQAEASSMENPGGGTSSNLPLVAPGSAPQDPSFLTVGSVGQPAHSMAPAPSETNTLAVVSAVEELLVPPALQEATQPAALTSQASGNAGGSGTKPDSAQLAHEDVESPLKKNLKLTGRALQTLLTKAVDIADTDPIKVALGLVKTVVEIKNAVKDNKDTVTQQIVATGGRLEDIEKALDGWKPVGEQGTSFIDNFNDALKGELQKLNDLNNESNFRKVVDYEDEQVRIKDIFVRINDARERFELVLRVKMFKAVYKIDEVVEDQALDRLKPSHIAHYDYTGREGQMLRRQVCTKGTRVRILGNITAWANNISPDCPNVYWLFGHAGSGKSTLAYTIAHCFESTGGDSDDMIILGGNFFCSRQFSETSDSIYIIRTIVYQLALKCKPFSDALPSKGLDSMITRNYKSQLESLLFGPWQKSEATRQKDTSLPLYYLFVIDALDEIEGRGGSDFLHALVTIINEISRISLAGLKFFVTSRSDKDLVKYVESLKHKHLYYLYDVEKQEAINDIAIYLGASLPHFKGQPEMDWLVAQADGLFIYASTVVKHVEGYAPAEHKRRLQPFLVHDSAVSQKLEDTLLDILYHQILSEASSYFRSEYYFPILYAILCSAEPTSATVIANLLPEVAVEIVEGVVQSLHALLYFQEHNILSHHKSFPDFIFDQARSKGFWCNKTLYHQNLTISCFNIMQGLHFNMANIPSSYMFDSKNDSLADEVKQNISSSLNYACRNWDHHLSATEPASDNILLGTLSDFLKLQALFWIEAMNLLGQCDHCYPMLQTAHDWVIKSEGQSPLPENLAEAGFFAQYFSTGSAWKSTPHLYISSLATWPRKADPVQHWRSCFSGIPKFTHAFMGGTLLIFLNAGSIVYSVAFSKNGHYIVSGSFDNLVRVWNALTGQEKHILSGHTDKVLSVAFSKNGSYIVSGSDDKSVRIWDAVTGQEKHVLNGHTDSVCAVAFSDNGCYIVSGSNNNSIIVWNALTYQKEHTLNGHTAGVQSVVFSSDSSHIVSGSGDKSVRVWSTITGTQSYVLNGHTEIVWSVAFSPDGNCIVSGSADRSACVWNVLTHQQIYVLNGHRNDVCSVAFSSDGRHIVSGSADRTVRVWDAMTGQQKHVLDGHTDTITSVAFSNDGSRIVSGSYDNTIRVWSALSDQEMHAQNGHTARVRCVSFSSDGTQIVSCSDDKTVKVWDAMTGLQKLVLKHPDKVYSVAFSPNAGCIVSGSRDKIVRVWNALTGLEEHLLYGHTNAISSVSFSSNGSHIASGSRDNSIRTWSALTGKVQYILHGHTNIVYCVAFSADGNYIVSGSFDKSVQVWDVFTGLRKLVLNGHTDYVYSVASSPNAKHIVSGSKDMSIRVWDALTGQAVHVLKGHTDIVWSVAFSSDGTHIVSGSEDKSIRVWDILIGQQKHVLHGHIGGVLSVAFSRDSSQIVSSSGHGDETIKVWVNPVHLSPHYIQEKTILSSGHLKPSGWLLSQQGDKYLMFVPPGSALPDNSHLFTTPSYKASSVDFSGSKLGLEWTKCYSV